MKYLFFVCLVLLLTPIILHYGFNFSWSSDFDTLLKMGIGFEVIAIILLLLIQFDVVGQEYVWVECKDLQKSANHKHAQKFINEYTNYNGPFKFKRKIFVSRSGFVDNALKYLEDNNVECYVLDNKKFKRTTYFQ